MIDPALVARLRAQVNTALRTIQPERFWSDIAALLDALEAGDREKNTAVLDLAARLAAMERERDEWRGSSQHNGAEAMRLCAERDAAQQELADLCDQQRYEQDVILAAVVQEKDAAQAEIARLRAALAQYGRHDALCHTVIHVSTVAPNCCFGESDDARFWLRTKHCTCGLDAARRGEGGNREHS